MQHKTIYLLIASALLACACDDKKGGGSPGAGVGVSAKGSLEAKESESSKVSRDSKFEVSKADKSMITAPAMRFLSDAIMDYTYESNIDPFEFRKSVYLMSDIKGLLKFPDKEFKVKIAALVSGVISANNTGWPVRPIRGNGVTTGAKTFTRNMLVATLFADQLLYSTWAKVEKLGTLKDPKAAKISIGRVLNEIPADDLRGMLLVAVDEADRIAKRSLYLDTAQGSGVVWSYGNYSFDFGSKGVVLTVSGIPQFGDGYINGKKIELALESATTGTIGSSSSDSTDSTSGAGTSQDASANVGGK